MSTPKIRFTDQVINGIVTSVWLWGAVVTFAFYAVLPFLPIHQELRARYFTAHGMEYLTTGLFFVGLVSLLIKAAAIPRERRALSAGWLDGLKVDSRLDTHDSAQCLRANWDSFARHCEDTKLVCRVREVIEAVAKSGRLDSQLRHSSDLASRRLHESHALVRTITWSIPVMGLLGSVIAITSVVPSKPTMSEMFASLAMSFDSMVSALGLSMTLFLGAFLIRQAEQQTLDDIEEVCAKQLTGLFPAFESSSTAQLEAAKVEFATICEQASKVISQQVAQSQFSLIEQQERSVALISDTWRSFHADLTAARDAQTLAMTRLTDSLTGAVMGWSDRLEEATRGMNDQVRELRVQASLLLKLTEQESELVQRVEQLTQALDSREGTPLPLNMPVNTKASSASNKAA